MPQAAPNATAKSRVAKMLPVILKIMTEKPASSDSMEPTERSISPVRQISPIPMAIMPTTAEWRKIFIIPFHVSPLQVKT